MSIKVLVVYYPQDDQSRYVAEMIRDELSGDIYPIDKNGKIGNVDENQLFSEYDMVVVGAFISFLSVPRQVKLFLKRHSSHFKKTAYYIITRRFHWHHLLVRMARVSARIPSGTLVLSKRELKERAHQGTVKDFINRIVDPLSVL